MKIAILTGGGPAPGMNGVIESVTLAACARGWSVLGVPRGFSGLMQGDTSAVRELQAADVAGIATRGGSILYTSRANPTKKKEHLEAVVRAFSELGVQGLVTIGGDDTASSAAAVADALAATGTAMRVAHVPKTIDNDLPLGDAPTFGFDTARGLGAQLCRNLRVDAETTGRWYLVSAMGRSAGHLALGMGMGSSADLVLVPEEFPDHGVKLDAVADHVARAIALRRKQGQEWGLCILGEGILDRLDRADLESHIGTLELDEHGNPRMSEVDLGAAVRDVLAARFKRQGQKVGFVTKIIGYELRCADPSAFDVQYTRSLGAGAVSFLAGGQGHAIISIQDGELRPLRFADVRGKDGRVKVRRLDLDGALWQAAVALQAR